MVANYCRAVPCRPEEKNPERVALQPRTSSMNFLRRSDGGKSASLDAESTSEPVEKLLKRLIPFERPVNPIRPPVFDLLEEETQKYEKLLESITAFAKDAKLVVGPDTTDTHPLVEAELAWLSKECLLRYLRATKWKVADAKRRIEDTLVWRRQFGVQLIPGSTAAPITPELVEPENTTGKNIIVGYDNDNRPCLYFRNGYQNTKLSIRQIQLLVYMLEKVIQLMPPGQDTLALLIDFKPAPPELNLSSLFPSISITKQVLYVLQSHYPERLGRGLFVNIPWIGQAFFKMAGPFIDPSTLLKAIYDQPFKNYVPSLQLDKEFNGDMNFVYEHDTYWPALASMGDQRYQQYLENFRKLGGTIGLSEYDMRLEGYPQEEK